MNGWRAIGLALKGRRLRGRAARLLIQADGCMAEAKRLRDLADRLDVEANAERSAVRARDGPS